MQAWHVGTNTLIANTANIQDLIVAGRKVTANAITNFATAVSGATTTISGATTALSATLTFTAPSGGTVLVVVEGYFTHQSIGGIDSSAIFTVAVAGSTVDAGAAAVGGTASRTPFYAFTTVTGTGSAQSLTVELNMATGGASFNISVRRFAAIAYMR